MKKTIFSPDLKRFSLSEHKKVEGFLDELRTFDHEKFTILQELRKLTLENDDEVTERMMYGGIMFSYEEDWGGIFARKNHISFEFGEGFKMDDPEKLLEGKGKKRRHLKIKFQSDISHKKVDFFIKQALNNTHKI